MAPGCAASWSLDVTRRCSFVDQRRPLAFRHEADVLAVGLVGDLQPQLPGDVAHLGLFDAGQGKAQEIELVARRGEQEIALVAVKIGAAAHRHASGVVRAADIVAGGHGLGAEILRRRQQVVELDRLIAADARHRRFAAQVAVGEFLDDGVAEAAFIVEDIMGDADLFGGDAGVVNVLAGAARTCLLQRRSMVVKLAASRR